MFEMVLHIFNLKIKMSGLIEKTWDFSVKICYFAWIWRTFVLLQEGLRYSKSFSAKLWTFLVNIPSLTGRVVFLLFVNTVIQTESQTSAKGSPESLLNTDQVTYVKIILSLGREINRQNNPEAHTRLRVGCVSTSQSRKVS